MVPDVQVCFGLPCSAMKRDAVIDFYTSRQRQQRGYTTDPLTPFVNAPQQILIAHCEQVHPVGWEKLKAQVAEARATEEIPV